ncbi:MAG TPA: LLM class F420-dependent oxidoreductase [Methylomirabilota bacterium]|nr:LLM class F420-dependent oxidoreductase [Methylomirabilota bacterium]
MAIKLGLFSMNQDACSHPDAAARVARAAEAAGFESLWCGEHVVLPDPQAPPSPMAPGDRILDPLVALSFLAAHTDRVRLGTGIIIVPQRNPVVLAKELASLDVLSNGRLIFGIGVGYLEPEFRAIGAPFAQRGAVTDEYVEAMQALWTQERPAFKGRFAAFDKVQAHPQPRQRGGPPIVVGGRTTAAFRRAVTRGHGWYGFGLDVEGAEKALAGLREAAARAARPAALGPLELSLTPRGFGLDRAMAERYAALGVHRLVLRPPKDLDVAGLEDFVRRAGDDLVGRV